MIDPISLGATLYMPATRDDLAPAILERRHGDLRSVVICLEDSIAPSDAPIGLLKLQAFLARLERMDDASARPAIFIRPRDPDMLATIVRLDAIDRIDGFVIPKATADTLPAYLSALRFDHHMLMPTLETREIFDAGETRRLRDQLLGVFDRVLALRIGGNDLLQTIGARRSAVRTAYDGPLGAVIANLVGNFAPWGFALSAPVFEGFGNLALLAEEVERDIEHGLLTKTAIHPCQIPVIHDAYRVDVEDHIAASAIVARATGGVFANCQTMCEPATHGAWSHTVLRRAEHFGLRQHELSTPQTA